MQVFLEEFLQFLEGAALYYVVPLGRSGFVSLLILLLIMLLRKTLFQKAVFLKGLLWTLLIPVPFMGKTIVLVDSGELAEAVTFDGHYLYVDTSVLDDIISLEEYRDKELGISFGGFYKIPGIGGGGDLVYVNGAELADSNCKIPYEESEDTFWMKLLKMI